MSAFDRWLRGDRSRREPPVPTVTTTTATTTTPVQQPTTSQQTQAALAKPTTFAETLPEPKTEAQRILRQEGIGTPKDVLKDVQIPTATTILESEGLSSAADILAIEEKEKEKFRKQQEERLKAEQQEANYLKLQDEYIQKIDPNNFKMPGQNIYDTKFGSIDFDQAVVKGNSYGGYNVAVDFDIPTGETLFKGTKYEKPKYERYTFIPADYVTKGVKNFNNSRYYFNEAFLKQDHWEKFLEKTQMIDISDFSGDANKFLKDRYDTNSSSVGFLMKRSDMLELLPSNSFKSRTLSNNMHGGEIQGLAYHPNLKKLVYVTQPKGRAQSSYLVYDDVKNTSVSWGHWRERSGFGKFVASVLGNDITNLLTDFAQAFAEIPFAPEIAAVVTKNKALYASLKALQVAGKGGNLEDVLKAGVTTYAVSSIPMDKLSNQVTDYLYQGGKGAITNQVAAKVVGGALTYSTFNGMIAAATGGNVKDAMTTGAIMGGVSNSGTEIANKIFGAGDSKKGAANIVKIADNLNMTSKQFTNIFVNSSVSASIAASRGGDFFKQFTNSAVAQGISTAAANKMKTSLQEAGMTEQNVKALTATTYNLVNAAAYASIRGTSVEEALKVVGQKEAQRQLASKLKQAYQERRQAV